MFACAPSSSSTFWYSLGVDVNNRQIVLLTSWTCHLHMKRKCNQRSSGVAHNGRTVVLTSRRCKHPLPPDHSGIAFPYSACWRLLFSFSTHQGGGEVMGLTRPLNQTLDPAIKVVVPHRFTSPDLELAAQRFDLLNACSLYRYIQHYVCHNSTDPKFPMGTIKGSLKR